MKRLATILMLIAAILVGGMTLDAKTTKVKAKAKTTQSSKKSSVKSFCKFWTDAYESLTIYKKANGEFFVKSGRVAIIRNNSAYLIEYVPAVAHGTGLIGVIYGNKFYEIANTMCDDENYGDIGNGYFNPSNMTLTYVNFNDKKKTVKVTNYKSYPVTFY